MQALYIYNAKIILLLLAINVQMYCFTKKQKIIFKHFILIKVTEKLFALQKNQFIYPMLDSLLTYLWTDFCPDYFCFHNMWSNEFAKHRTPAFLDCICTKCGVWTPLGQAENLLLDHRGAVSRSRVFLSVHRVHTTTLLM